MTSLSLCSTDFLVCDYRRGRAVPKYLYTHSVLNKTVRKVFVPEETKIILMVFTDVETVKHLLYIGCNGNCLSPEAYEHTKKAIC